MDIAGNCLLNATCTSVYLEETVLNIKTISSNMSGDKYAMTTPRILKVGIVFKGSHREDSQQGNLSGINDSIV